MDDITIEEAAVTTRLRAERSCFLLMVLGMQFRRAVAAALMYMAYSQGALAACTYGACAPSNAIINTKTTQYAATLATDLIANRISQVMSSFGGVDVAMSSTGTSALAYAPSTAEHNPLFSIGGGGTLPLGGTNPVHRYDQPTRFGVWADIGTLYVHDSQVGADYRGNIVTGIAGLDYVLNDRLLIGFAAGHERINFETPFNLGTISSSGFAGSIYGGYRLSTRDSLDFTAGYESTLYSESHSTGSGEFTGNRWFGTSNFNSRFDTGPWRLSTSIGTFYVEEKQSAFLETNGNAVAASSPYLVQARIKGTAGYSIATGWGTLLPYASARFEFDLAKSGAPVINSLGQTASQGPFGTTLTLGLSAKSGNMTSSIEATTTQFKQNIQAFGLNGTVRWTLPVLP